MSFFKKLKENAIIENALLYKRNKTLCKVIDFRLVPKPPATMLFHIATPVMDDFPYSSKLPSVSSFLTYCILLETPSGKQAESKVQV